MRYLMIFRPTDDSGETEDPPTQAEIDAMGQFMSDMGSKGYLLAADGLRPSAHGFKVRKKDKGKFAITDGPFTEAKEIVAGFAIVDVPTREIGIDIAKRFLDVAGEGEWLEVRLMHDQPAFPRA